MYQKISVLIIEDEKSICDFIGKTLDSHEYKVTAANNGKDGLALITSSLPDLVLRQEDGSFTLVKRFSYSDFKGRLS